MPISGILFDCDGVLVDSEIVGLDDAVAFLNSTGLRIGRDEVIRRFTGMRTDDFQGEMRDAYDASLARRSSDREFQVLFDGFVNARRAKRYEMRLVEGAELALAAAAALAPQVKLAIASSSAQEFLDGKVDRYGLRGLVGMHAYSADHVTHGKPAPDIFLYAARKIGVPISECLVIEDSAHGVAAGVAAGARVWGFTGGGHCRGDHDERLRAAGAVRIFRDHPALVEAFKAL